MSKKQAVFVRDATGLVREISPFAAIVVGVFGVSIGLSVNWGVTATPTLYPGSNLVITMALALIPAFLLVCLYATLSGAMPRSGGEYVWASRLVYPAFGFMISWALFLANLTFAGANLVLTFSWFVNGYFYLLGTDLNNPSLIALGVAISQPTSLFILATVLNVIFLGFMMLSAGKQMKVYNLLFVIAIVGTVALMLKLLLTSQADFVSAFDAQYGSGEANTIIQTAEQAGAVTSWNWGASLTAVAYMTGFIPVYYAAWYSGEIKNAKSNAPMAMYISSALMAFFIIAFAALLYNSMGYRFMSALAYLSVSAPSLNPFVANFSVNYAVLLITKDIWLTSLISISFILWCAICTLTILFSATRVLFAYSFDRILPNAICSVNERTHSPVNATIICIIGCEITAVLYIFTTALTNLIAATAASWVCWAGVGLTAILLPYRRRDIWESSPITKKRIAGVPLVSLVGVLVVLIAIVFLPYLFITGAGVITPDAAVMFAVMTVGALIVFYLARAFRGREGINLDLAYREIPPE